MNDQKKAKAIKEQKIKDICSGIHEGFTNARPTDDWLSQDEVANGIAEALMLILIEGEASTDSDRSMSLEMAAQIHWALVRLLMVNGDYYRDIYLDAMQD